MSAVTPTILSNGAALDPGFQLLALETRKEVNRIPTAYLSLVDGGLGQQEQFPVSDSSFFALGRKIEIRLRYEGETGGGTAVFKGLVVNQAIESSRAGSRIMVTLKDAALKMTYARRHAVFRNQRDSDVIRKLITQNKLSAGQIDRSPVTHRELLQYNATDWDFMLLRSQLNGQVVSVDDGVIAVRQPKAAAGADHTFTYGSSIYDLHMQLDGRAQVGSLTSAAWDNKTKTLTKGVRGSSASLAQGNVTPAQAAQAVGASAASLVDPVSLTDDALQAWADGEQAYRSLALLRGTVAVAGNGGIKPLQTIQLAGIGKRFDGRAVVTGVRHTVDAHGWQTVVQFGLPPERFAERTDISAPAAAGHLPPVHGLHIGVVAPYESAPDGEQWIKVTLPTLPQSDGPIWARLLQPDAGQNRGVLFIPEPGDEVIVGFLNNDPRQAVILGSVFNSAADLPQLFPSPSAENRGKGIVTKAGSALIFDDADGKPSLTIQTAAGNRVHLDEDSKSVEISDQHGNKITLNQSGIVIKSSADLHIEASGNVKIKGSLVDIS